MARYTVATRSAGAGSTTLPLFSLYAAATSGAHVREIGVFNTTSTAVAIAVQRFSTTGTQGTGLTELNYNENDSAAAATGFNTHTIAPTAVAGFLRQASLGAAIGSGVIWTFGDTGLVIKPGTGNGIGVIIATGTGQVVDFYIDWDE